jgi:hypothetical protein
MAPRLKVIVSIAALGALLVRVLRRDLIPADAVTVTLIVAAVLPWLGALFDTAEFPGGWKFKFRELENRTNELQDEVEKTRRRIDDLFVSAMSPLALQNLGKIASGNFGPYFLGQGLSWQLLHFASIGYISFKCRGIDEIPQNGHQPKELNLSDFVEVTDLGREYLALRELIDRRRQTSKV